MADFTQVKWIGRDGQGVVTAAVIFAEITASMGNDLQVFPVISHGKKATPFFVYNRISDTILRSSSDFQTVISDIVAVIDSTLLVHLNIKDNTDENTSFIINTTLESEKIKEKFDLKSDKIYCFNASKIAVEKMGDEFQNILVITAIVSILQLMPVDDFKIKLRGALSKRFSEEIVNANIKAVDPVFREVRSG